MSDIVIEAIPQAYDIKDSRRDKLMKQHPALPKPPFRLVLLGASGSGKSSFVYSLIKKYFVVGRKPFFDQVLIFSGSCDSNSAWSDLLNHEGDVPFISNEWNAEMVEQYLKEIENEHTMAVKDNICPTRILIILDDLVCDGITNKHRMNIIDRLFVQISRHYNVSVIIITQFLKALNRNVRSVNLSHMVLYPITKNDLDMVAVEHCPAHMTQNEFKDTITKIWNKKPFNFAVLDYSTTPDKRIRDGLNRILKTNKSAKKTDKPKIKQKQDDDTEVQPMEN